MTTTPLLDAKVKEIYFRKEYQFRNDIIYERVMHALRDWFFENLGRHVDLDYGYWDCDVRIAITKDEAQFLENKLQEAKTNG